MIEPIIKITMRILTTINDYNKISPFWDKVWYGDHAQWTMTLAWLGPQLW